LRALLRARTAFAVIGGPARAGPNGNAVRFAQKASQCRGCPRNCKRQAALHVIHWGPRALGRRRGATSREPGDRPLTVQPKPPSVGRLEETCSKPVAGPHRGPF
jgi:hypothetical protein